MHFTALYTAGEGIQLAAWQEINLHNIFNYTNLKPLFIHEPISISLSNPDQDSAYANIMYHKSYHIIYLIMNLLGSMENDLQQLGCLSHFKDLANS